MRRPFGAESHAVSSEVAWWRHRKPTLRSQRTTARWVEAATLVAYSLFRPWARWSVAETFGVREQDVEHVRVRSRPGVHRSRVAYPW